MLFGQKPSRRKKASEFTTLVIGEFFCSGKTEMYSLKAN